MHALQADAERKVQEVKMILSGFTCLYIRRNAWARGHFTMEDNKK